MPKFENETWIVEKQFPDVTWMTQEELASRGPSREDGRVVGYLLRSETPDGGSSEIVTTHGILATDRDLEISILFAASKDLFNAAEAVLPILHSMGLEDFGPDALAAVRALEDAVARASAPGIDHDHEDEPEAATRP